MSRFDRNFEVADAGRTLLAVDGVSLGFGGVYALDDIGFDVGAREILSIIGPNGAGKSSLLNCINGVYRPQAGSITFCGRAIHQSDPTAIARLGIARTFQHLALFAGMTVRQNVMAGRNLHMRAGLLMQMIPWGAARREERLNQERADEAIAFVDLAAHRDDEVTSLPYGLQKRVDLARALAMEPCLLLLDEPMAGMNHAEKRQMCRCIVDINRQFETTIVLIEHDMGVVMDLSDRIVVLDHGRKIGDGSPAEIRSDRAVIEAYLGLKH